MDDQEIIKKIRSLLALNKKFEKMVKPDVYKSYPNEPEELKQFERKFLSKNYESEDEYRKRLFLNKKATKEQILEFYSKYAMQAQIENNDLVANLPEGRIRIRKNPQSIFLYKEDRKGKQIGISEINSSYLFALLFKLILQIQNQLVGKGFKQVEKFKVRCVKFADKVYPDYKKMDVYSENDQQEKQVDLAKFFSRGFGVIDVTPSKESLIIETNEKAITHQDVYLLVLEDVDSYSEIVEKIEQLNSKEKESLLFKLYENYLGFELDLKIKVLKIIPEISLLENVAVLQKKETMISVIKQEIKKNLGVNTLKSILKNFGGKETKNIDLNSLDELDLFFNTQEVNKMFDTNNKPLKPEPLMSQQEIADIGDKLFAKILASGVIEQGLAPEEEAKITADLITEDLKEIMLKKVEELNVKS